MAKQKNVPWSEKEEKELLNLVDSFKGDKTAAFIKFAETSDRKPASIMQKYYVLKTKEKKNLKKSRKPVAKRSSVPTAKVTAKQNSTLLEPLITLIGNVEIERYEIEHHKITIHY